MRKLTIIAAFAISALSFSAYAQDIAQSNVPSLVVTNFQQAFSKARDIEWEMDGDLFKVEFEIGMFGPDHEAWYNAEGQLLKHKEEISKADLPEKVQATIKNEFEGYRVDDVKKLTAGNEVTYLMELKKLTEEWKVAIDANGKTLSKIAD
jgi:uncharacterized membrane protein YkoI